MSSILEEIGLTRLPHYTVLRDWFETIPMAHWRAFLHRSAEKRIGHAAVDVTGFDRDQPSRHYVQRAHYHVRLLKVTTLVDVNTLYVTDVHCTTTKKHDVKGFRDELCSHGVRPPIKHRLHNSLNYAHNARMDSNSYNRRWMVETAFSAIKRTLGSAMRARSWPLELREIILKCTVYHLRRSVIYL